jgi:exodeoxyribonuclease V alpha subunit
MKLDAQQLAAVARAVSGDRVTLISGGAGTGKTTIVKNIADELERMGEKPVLCAFAGKAAARLREACGRNATTLHRLLGYDGKRFAAATDALAGASVIIDEASMIDAALLAEVVRRKPRRLILVGDQAQLPPVGRGQPYHDLLALRPDLAVNLTRCYRNKEAVFQAASAIRAGNCPPAQLTTDGEKWRLLNTGDAERTQAALLAWVTAPEAWDFDRDIILICRNGESADEPATVRGLNAAIAQAVRPRDEKTKFVVGDRVINGKNLPDLDMWNGSTGRVAAIDIDGGVWVQTDVPVVDHARRPGGGDGKDVAYTNRVLFTKATRGNLSLAYALTCHKAQGSQARRVIVVCLDRDAHGLLSRSWIYTAVTRAREAAVVVGQVSAFRAGVQKVEIKRTVLQELSVAS